MKDVDNLVFLLNQKNFKKQKLCWKRKEVSSPCCARTPQISAHYNRRFTGKPGIPNGTFKTKITNTSINTILSQPSSLLPTPPYHQCPNRTSCSGKKNESCLVYFPNKTISFQFCHFLRRKWNKHILTKIMNFFVNYTQKYVRRLPTSRLHSQSFTNLCLLISSTFIWHTKRDISQSWLFVTASSLSFISEWTENLALLAHLIFSSSFFWHAKPLTRQNNEFFSEFFRNRPNRQATMKSFFVARSRVKRFFQR